MGNNCDLLCFPEVQQPARGLSTNQEGHISPVPGPTKLVCEHLGVARCLAQAVLGQMLRHVLPEGEKQSALRIFGAVLSAFTSALGPYWAFTSALGPCQAGEVLCNWHLEGFVSARSHTANLTQQLRPWMIFVQRCLNLTHSACSHVQERKNDWGWSRSPSVSDAGWFPRRFCFIFAS